MNESKILANRKSVHYFCRTKPSDRNDNFMSGAMRDIIKWDCLPGPFGNSPRLHYHEPGLGNYRFRNEIGWVVGSHFVSKNAETNNQIVMDLSYKMLRLSLDLKNQGFSSCFASYSLDQEQAMKLSQPFHTMEYDTPIGLAFGTENTSSTFPHDFVNNQLSDKYRLPVSSFAEDLGNSEVSYLKPELIEILSVASKAPSMSNTQTWKTLVGDKIIHFYATSELSERYLNMGCFLGAFAVMVESKNYKGMFQVLKDAPKTEGEYCVSWVFSKH